MQKSIFWFLVYWLQYGSQTSILPLLPHCRKLVCRIFMVCCSMLDQVKYLKYSTNIYYKIIIMGNLKYVYFMYYYHEIKIRYIFTYNRGPMWKWHWWMHFQSMSPWWCVYWWPKHLHMHVWSRLQRSALWAWTGWMYQRPMSQQRHMSWYGRDVHVWMSGWIHWWVIYNNIGVN